MLSFNHGFGRVPVQYCNQIKTQYQKSFRIMLFLRPNFNSKLGAAPGSSFRFNLFVHLQKCFAYTDFGAVQPAAGSERAKILMIQAIVCK